CPHFQKSVNGGGPGWGNHVGGNEDTIIPNAPPNPGWTGKRVLNRLQYRAESDLLKVQVGLESNVGLGERVKRNVRHQPIDSSDDRGKPAVLDLDRDWLIERRA